MGQNIHVYLGDELAAYGFPEGHPFGTDRQEAFWREALRQGLNEAVVEAMPVMAGRDVIEWFHTREYVEKVMTLSRLGYGYLDDGDTPAFPGVYEAASHVAGSAVDGLKRIVEGRCRAVFQPIGGLHHARRARRVLQVNDIGGGGGAPKPAQHRAGGLRGHRRASRRRCVLTLKTTRADPGGHPRGWPLSLSRHRPRSRDRPGQGRGHQDEPPMAPGPATGVLHGVGAGGEVLRRFKPEFILFRGADSLAGDPLAHLRYSPAAHAHAARRLKRIAGEYCDGRLIAFGGGGYNRKNLALAWCAVLKELASPD